MTEFIKKKPTSFSDFLRVLFKGVLDPIGAFLIRAGIMPNTMTMIGVVGNILGAILLATGAITWGGIVILLMGPIDALDGTMARIGGKVTSFGAFLDSVSDRYSELIIFGGLLIYYIRQDNLLAIGLVYLAAAGSVLVSYVKARAESLDYEAKVGILTRVERFLVLSPCLVINQPMIALWIIGILANLTALQRIYHVLKQARNLHPPVDPPHH